MRCNSFGSQVAEAAVLAQRCHPAIQGVWKFAKNANSLYRKTYQRIPESKDVSNPLAQTSHQRHRGLWQWFGVSLLVALAVLTAVAEVVLHSATPIVKGRVVETLSARFNSTVQLDNLEVSVFHGLEVSGDGLRIYPPDDLVAAGATQPLIVIRRFTFRAHLLGLFVKPTHVDTVHVSGLQINIPPSEARKQNVPSQLHRGKIKIQVADIVCDDSQVIIDTEKPGKDPKQFRLKHIVLHDVGPNGAWPYNATLINAIPTGNIEAVGTFGPWNVESPGDSPVVGRYTFDHADLSTIKGLGGILSSVGNFQGRLNRIDVEGTTETPDFSLDTAQHPLPLHTQFRAIVDGTSGDTYLHSVEAKLAESSFTCKGAVVNVKGKGHTIDLELEIGAGRIQDFLALAVKTDPPVMNGTIKTEAKVRIAPGKESVSQKLQINGGLILTGIHFTDPAVQDRVDMLSLRARGEPHLAKPGAENVSSEMTGHFVLANGKLDFSSLNYAMPGATVRLTGLYTLDGQQFQFSGKVRTNAKLSQMVATWWKSWLLKGADPFFQKHGAGTEIPVKISGTRSAPKFGLNLGSLNGEN
jgi:hypothetical protein